MHDRARSGAMMKIFLVDDSPLVRQRMAALTRAIKGVEIVGEAEDAGDALSGIAANINGSGGDTRIAQIGRNTFRYAPVSSIELRFSKETALSERCKLEVMGEGFNLLNHQNVTRTDTVGYTISGASSASTLPHLTYQPSFGTVTNANSSTIYRERQIQLAFRLIF